MKSKQSVTKYTLKEIGELISQNKSHEVNYFMKVFMYFNDVDNVVYDTNITNSYYNGWYYYIKANNNVVLTGGEVSIERNNKVVRSVGYSIDIAQLENSLSRKVKIQKKKIFIHNLNDKQSKSSLRIYLDYYGFSACFNEDDQTKETTWSELTIKEDVKYNFFGTAFDKIPVNVKVNNDRGLIENKDTTLGDALLIIQSQNNGTKRPVEKSHTPVA